jgi:hydrogenase nickel incorporation protein HypA/HybF
MHELEIAESVVEMLHECADGREVGVVRLSIGQLSGVVPDTLRFCFELATVGTDLESSLLEIEMQPGLAHCRSCAQDFSTDSSLACRCGSTDVELISGRQLTVESVEVD